MRVTVVDENKAVVCCLLATSAIMLSEKKTRKRKMCSTKWYLESNISCDVQLLNELLETDVEDYVKYLKMNEQPLNTLLTKMSPYVQNNNTRLREAISLKRRITATLRYLATSSSFEDMKFSLREYLSNH